MLRLAAPASKVHEIDGPQTPGGRVTVTAERTSTGGTRRAVQYVRSQPMTAPERATKKRRLEALFPKRQAAARAADAKRKREATPDEAALAARRKKKKAADAARLQREREEKAAALASLAAARMADAATAAVSRPQPRPPPQQNPACEMVRLDRVRWMQRNGLRVCCGVPTESGNDPACICPRKYCNYL